MGGFARYPWPQHISNAPFYYNKHYKRAVGITLFAGFVNYLWIVRFARYHMMENPGFGSYVDPEHPHAPKQTRLV